jgi:putative radical SAM enzyme (TIGR03279 family)
MKKYKNQVEENEQFRIARNDTERILGLRGRASDGGRRTAGAVLTEIEPGSIAEELGIEAGARLVQINESPVRDAIQLKMADVSERISLTVIQPDGTPRIYDIEKDAFEPLGMGTDAELFDGVTRCKNKCPFCFVDQLPPRLKEAKNLRRTLYVRDDDYRLSFMHGHYITLTNLSETDYARIIEEKLSPLCVSVQATDPATRIRMLGNATAGNILERLHFLIDNGIQINAQIVLCPGINDKEQLDRSVEDLMELWPGVESVAVVPVGLTKYMPDNRGMRTVRPEEARAIIDQLKSHQARCLEKFGVRFAYASDEMYLLAGRPVPTASFYDGFPQYANGVGLIRAFTDEVQKVRRRKFVTNGSAPPRITIVTGSLAAPALRNLASALNEKQLARAEVAEVVNTFWGGNVACAGLLMGEEVLAQLRGRDVGQFVFLPPDAVDNQNRMLDDITLAQMSQELGTTVRCDATGPLQMAQLLSRN